MTCNLIQEEFNQIIEVLNLEQLKNKSILVTGANGLIGAYLVKFLIFLNENKNINCKIYALSRSIEKLQKIFNQNQVEFIEQDLNTPFTTTLKFDYIIHAASNSHPLAFSTDPVGTMQTNLLGTMNLLEIAKQSNSKFLYLSTGEIYGNNEDKPFSENDIGKVDSKLVRSCYPESKRAAETLCMAYKQQYDVKVNIARLCYVYGATITDTNSRADAQFLRNALNNENIVMKSEGLQKRTYCYVADTVSALLYILLNGENGEVYNVANNKSVVSVREYSMALAKLANVDVIFEIPDKTEARGYSKQANSILDASKLENLGWKPMFPFEEGIEHTYKIKKDALC